MSEYRAQALTVGATDRSRAAEELVRVQSALTELQKQKVSDDDQLGRTVIRSPVNGTVDKLAVKTIGAPIGPGDTLLEVVPDADTPTVEALVSPTDIDQVSSGQPAILLFSGLNRQTTPELTGRVSFVSPDRTTVDRGNSFYRVTIELPDSELKKLGAIKLRVGMPVEAFIQTQERTLMSFLMRPLTDQAKRAFRSN